MAKDSTSYNGNANLKKIGVKGVIFGRAFYDGKIRVENFKISNF